MFIKFKESSVYMGWFKRKTRGSNLKDESIRQLALDKRRANTELRNAQQEADIERIKAKTEFERLKMKREQLMIQQEIENMTEYDDEPEEQKDDNPLNGIIQMMAMKMMQSSNNVNSMPSPNASFDVPTQVSLSDEALDEAIKRIPKVHKKLIAKVGTENLKSMVEYLRSCDDDTINRFLAKTKEF